MKTKLQLILAIILFIMVISEDVHAVGTWNGQDTLHVPLSWCAVQGSPAAVNPNINGDTTTDAVLWRRHERPTDNIYINPSGITFRSAINNAWGTLNFPIIADPDTTVGVQGDMRGEDVNANGAEFNQILNGCTAAWANLGRAGIGVNIVNAGLFHDANGDYVGVIGWGGCAEFPAGTCVAPFDGVVVVVDNNYLFPTVADRTFPPSPADPTGNLQFPITDSLDILTGHELGHALSLNHRNNNQAMMNPGITDNNADIDADNVGLSNAEINDLRANALNVPGLELDPPGQFNPGKFVAIRQVDSTRERKDLAPYLDIASVKVALDKEKNIVSIGPQLFGLLPTKGKAVEFWFLVDTDGTGNSAQNALLDKIKAPKTNFKGADLIIKAVVERRKITSSAWKIKGDNLISLDRQVTPELHTLVVYPHFLDIKGRITKGPKDKGHPVNHTVSVKLGGKTAEIMLNKKFTVQVITVDENLRVADKLDETTEEKGLIFILKNPSFPHCFPNGVAKPGEIIKIEIEKLTPNAKIHGLLGPKMVFTGITDKQGGGIIDFPIPADTTPGYHLVTIGVDNTALTADCTVKVIGKPKTIPPDIFSLLKSHEFLLKGQQQLIDNLGLLVREIIGMKEVSEEQTAELIEQYSQLVRKQAELLESFESLIRREIQ